MDDLKNAAQAMKAPIGIDWTDPANRKAAWEMKALRFVREALDSDEAEALTERYIAGDPRAKAAVEKIVYARERMNAQ